MVAPALLIAFDLDDTLAASKSALEPRMGELLVDLLSVAQVCIISGGQMGQFRAQVLDRLPNTSPTLLQKLHLMPTCGTQYYRYREGDWQRIYIEALTDDEKQSALRSVEARARQLGLWEERTWGPILEDRGSQITFSALGQAAPIEQKLRWDPTGEKKAALRDAVQADIPGLEVRGGGSTSIDITRRGIDKAYGMKRLRELTGVGFDDMVFVGDRLDEGGNDYPVVALGIECVPVEGWQDTARYIESVLAS